MDRLSLTFACGRYDRTEALRTGDVTVEGIDLKYVSDRRAARDFRSHGGAARIRFVGTSSSEFISMTGRGNCPFVALPVFPSRAFRHGFIFINKRAGSTRERSGGKRIGVPLYTQTAAI